MRRKALSEEHGSHVLCDVSYFRHFAQQTRHSPCIILHYVKCHLLSCARQFIEVRVNMLMIIMFAVDHAFVFPSTSGGHCHCCVVFSLHFNCTTVP